MNYTLACVFHRHLRNEVNLGEKRIITQRRRAKRVRKGKHFIIAYIVFCLDERNRKASSTSIQVPSCMDSRVDFSSEIRCILSNPSKLSVQQGMKLATRLHNFLEKSGQTAPPWSGKDSRDMSVSASKLSPQTQLMRQIERVLVLELEDMRRTLLEELNCLMSYDDVISSSVDNSQRWQTLNDKLLQPMDRLRVFSKVLQACVSPMRQWLSDSVLIGHRRLCLPDLIRQLSLDHFLKPVTACATIAIFKTIHYSEHKWEPSDLQPVHQFVSLLQEYQKFQRYLSSARDRSGPYDQWHDSCSPDELNTAAADEFTVAKVLFEPYLDCLKQFYRPKLDPFDSNLIARNVSDWLMSEEFLAVNFGIKGFRDSVVNCVLQETVKNHLDALGETVMNLLIENDSQSLSLFFSVMVMVEGGQDRLLEVLRLFVKDRLLQVFDGIKEEFKSLDPNSAKATSMYVETCASQLRYCKAIIETTIELQQSPSLSRSLLFGTVRAGIADVLNACGGGSLTEAASYRHNPGSSYPATALAHYFHRQMRSIRTLDAGAVQLLEDLMTLYSLLEDKEAFLLRYHALLRERLLSEACDQLSLEAETFALESLTKLSGWKALYEVRSVLKDFRESESFNAELRELAEYRDLQLEQLGDQPPIRFSFVRGYFWRIATETVQLPRLLAPLADVAISAYQSRHSGRQVSLAYSYGSGLLAFSPRRRRSQAEPIQLRCSAAVMLILLHCEEAAKGDSVDRSDSQYLAESDLQISTGIKASDLAFYLHHLTRAGVLVAAPGGQEFEAEVEDEEGCEIGRKSFSRYAVNDDFDSNAKQVNLMILKQQQAQKQRRRLEKLDQRMKEKKVQCALVTAMKQQRRLTRKQLFELVQKRLPQLKLQEPYLSDQLTYLISGGYMKYITVTDDTATAPVDIADDTVIEYIP